MNRARSKRLARGALGVTLLALAGCGYTSGSRATDDASTVGIEMFGNTSFVPDLEVVLHRQIVAAIERSVAMRVVAPEDADLIVRGAIVDYSGRGGIRGGTNTLLETGIRVRVRAELARADALGPPLRRTGFGSESGFRVDENLGPSKALDRIMRSIADRVVLDLFSPLDYEPAVLDDGDTELPPVEGS